MKTEPETRCLNAEASAALGYIALVADIVSAFVSNNSIRPEELPDLIASVHASITSIEHGAAVEPEAVKREPAVTVKKSLGDGEHLISLIDGKKYRTLKRHLGTHGMTPDEYRSAFDLPLTYPMVAPAYSEKRSALARKIGLGNFASDDSSVGKRVPKEGAKPRGRPRKDAA